MVGIVTGEVGRAHDTTHLIHHPAIIFFSLAFNTKLHGSVCKCTHTYVYTHTHTGTNKKGVGIKWLLD